MNVIMSNLLQQLNLNADQLQDRLPDYVPTTLRKAIVHNYKACTPIDSTYSLFLSVLPMQFTFHISRGCSKGGGLGGHVCRGMGGGGGGGDDLGGGTIP